MIRNVLENAVANALQACGAEGVPFSIERPAAMEHGDYATNAALVAAKKLSKSPREVAEQIVAQLGTVEGVERVEVAGAGFINFHLSRKTLVPAPHGAPHTYEGKRVLVEYTSPNLFKPLHIGNLIGNILGESIARLYAASGAEVVRINYPSDIGLTVAKGVWGLRANNLNPADIEQLGKAYVLGSEAYENGSAKEEIESINRALYEDSDKELTALRRAGIETSRKHLDDLCARLGTTFDKEFFESEAAPVGVELVRKHTGSVFEESEGAVVYRGEQDGLHTRVFLNSQGLPTYEAKDLGLFELKRRAYPHFDITITDTGSEQAEYFKVLYAVVRKVFPDSAEKELLHSAHGFLRLTTGKMSSRKGNVITGESLIEELISAAKEKMQGRELANAENTAEQIAIGAIKYAVLKQGSGKDIVFDPEKSLSLEGDSGPYLQYAHTRAQSLLRTAKEAGVTAGTNDMPEHASVLERTLLHYADAVERAVQKREPHYITTYLTELAGAFNSWYASNRVVGGEHPHYGVFLTEATARTLADGLSLLGIPVPEEM